MRIVLLAATVCTAVPVVAEAADKAKRLDPNQVICRSEPVTGSRLATERTCLTRTQWKQQRDELRKSVEQMQTLGHFVPDP